MNAGLLDRVAHIICFVMPLMPVVALSWAVPALGELERGHHAFAMVQTVQICPRQGTQNRFAIVRIYRKGDGGYLYYTLTEDGAEFGPDGGVSKNTMDGYPLTTIMSLNENIDVLETYRHPLSTVQFGVSIEIIRGRCRVVGCIFKSELDRRTGCVSKCRPEGCEVRPGPASN